MYGRILVPTDGSAGSERVATHAAELAATTGAEVFAVYVIDEKAVRAGAGEPPSTDVGTAFEARGRAALDAVEDIGADHGVPVSTELRRGTPHRGIVDYAVQVGADVIVMGTHGRKGLQRYLLGSVTEHVLREAEQPVLALKLEGADVSEAVEAEALAREAVDRDGAAVADLRDEPYRERSTWVVPVVTERGDRINVHVDAVTGDARLAHLD